jgi:SAM-dependent methyltransferase
MKEVRRRVLPWTLFGVDIDVAACEKCRITYGAVVKQSTAICMPFSEDFADVVIASDVIEHLDYEYHAYFADELVRVTKPGGVIVITTPVVHHSEAKMERLHHRSHASAERLCELFSGAEQLAEKRFYKTELTDPTVLLAFRK